MHQKQPPPKYALLIFGITAFFIYNTYHDGIYLKKIMSYKKYYTMIMWGFLGLSLYLFTTKYPTHTREMVGYANQFVKYMPIDKQSLDLLNPILDMTTNNVSYNLPAPSYKRMMNSGKMSNNRSVSETKKKYVASQQNWRCLECNDQLQAWFEVDHKVRLENGGSNHISNLRALCRNCHGKKTAMENM